MKSIFLAIILISISSVIVADASAQSNNNSNSETPGMLSIGMPNISVASINDFFIKIQNDIIYGTSFYDLVGFAVGMVIYGIFIFHFYRFLAKRDLFNINLARRLSSGNGVTKVGSVFAFIATNFFIYPIVIFVWFIVYSLFMFFLAQGLEPATVFLVVSALVIAVRIAAYYNEDLAKDLAKLLPFSMLGFFLLSPTFFTVDDIVSRLNQLPSFVENIAVFLVFAIAVETVLSISYVIKHKIKPSSEIKLEEKIEKQINEKIKVHVDKLEDKHEEVVEKMKEETTKLKDKIEEGDTEMKDKIEEGLDSKKDKQSKV